MIFGTNIQIPLPEIGFRASYPGDGPDSAVFTVVDVNKDTGCIYLDTPDREKAERALEIDDKDKYGKPIKSRVFAWDEKRKLYAVNVAWDVWAFMHVVDVPPPPEANEALKRAFRRHKELVG